jgi:hypothetical protein
MGAAYIKRLETHSLDRTVPYCHQVFFSAFFSTVYVCVVWMGVGVDVFVSIKRLSVKPFACVLLYPSVTRFNTFYFFFFYFIGQYLSVTRFNA